MVRIPCCSDQKDRSIKTAPGVRQPLLLIHHGDSKEENSVGPSCCWKNIILYTYSLILSLYLSISLSLSHGELKGG